MIIKDIELKNYKGFKDCTIKFHPKVNVFIGNNASGKTSLLTAIVKNLVSITTNFAQLNNMINREKMFLSDTDINYNEICCSVKLIIDKFPNYHTKIKSLVDFGAFFPSEEREDFRKNKMAFIEWYSTYVKTTTSTVPIIKYYHANRGTFDYLYTSGNRKNYFISQLETWDYIYQDSLSYSSFFKWFLENETSELRLQRDSKDLNIENPALRDVRKALRVAFKKLGYDNVVLKSDQIKRQGNSDLVPVLLLENLENKKTEDLSHKSDGEKAMISLISDIAYNLSIAKDFIKNDDFLNSPGIVLIDEIEMHLHPNWQRKIVPILTEIFPNIQFFITTHSPQIISSVKSESIFLLNKFKAEKVNLKTKGEDTNSILKFIFNSTERPDKYIDLINKFDTLIEEEAKPKELEEIIKEIKKIDREDLSTPISNLFDELNIRLEAYKFDIENEKNN